MRYAKSPADRSVRDKSTLGRLKTVITEKLSGQLRPGEKFALLDFPNYANVGDSAIWMGELAYFAAVHRARPTFVSTKDNWDPASLRQTLPAGTIFLSGGGNFGDLWPEQQAFRESVLAQFPDRPIVQLPQSIHFDDLSAHRRAAKAIAKHGRFVLYVRDRRSFETAAAAYDCQLHLAPDMAFWLGPILRPVKARHQLLMLLRADRESSRGTLPRPEKIPNDAVIADWLTEDPNLFVKFKFLSAAASPVMLGLNARNKSNQRELLFRNLAMSRLNRGIRQLASAEFVITDRLHSYILCLLLGIPHIVCDNSYQKLGAFIDTWTPGQVSVAGSVEEALEFWSGRRSSPVTYRV